MHLFWIKGLIIPLENNLIQSKQSSYSETKNPVKQISYGKTHL